MNFMKAGELWTHLKDFRRFPEEHAKFYVC